MADPKLWTKFDSTDIEDAAETGRLHSMKPQMPQQRHCNCVHDVLPHTPGARPSRNLVVCIDGTANQFSDKNTNVVELYSRLEKSEHLQVTFYNSGIGTYASPSWKSLTYYKQVMYHKIDLAVAWRFEKILLSAYQWLCEQYQTGDRIFLFGFSRGAYQVRALSAMIEKVGLIHRGNEAQIPFAYDLYQQHSVYESDTEAKSEVNEKGSEKIKSQAPPEDIPKHEDQSFSNEKMTTEPGPQTNGLEHANLKAATGKPSNARNLKPDDAAARFKRTFCRTDAKVHFVGVWDTVSSVGFAKKKELPLTTEGMKHVCLFRHALALDERRVKFLPEFVNGGTGPEVGDQNKSASEMPHTKEVWFPGTHSDIGGGNIENKGLNNNGPALRWMITEASKAGLLLIPFSWRWDQVRIAKNFNESLTGFWKVLEILPIRRLSYEGRHETTRRPHMGAQRKILEGQLVHRSVYGSDRLHLEYRDHLKPWDGKDVSRIEPDTFDQVTHHIEYAIDLLSNMEASGQRYHHLSHLNHTSYMFGTDEAIQAYINLSHALFYPVDLDDPVIQRRTVATMEVLETLASELFVKQHFSRQPPVIRDLLRSDASKQRDIMERIETFLDVFGTAEIFSIRRNGPFSSFAFSPDSKLIVCGTASGNIFFRDAITGAAVQSKWKAISPYHDAPVSCLAFSHDGKKVVSGGHDKLIRLWDVESGNTLGYSYPTASGKILSVSFAWDGRIVATSESDTIRIFNSGDYLELLDELKGHGHDVLAAVFSPKVPSSAVFRKKDNSGTVPSRPVPEPSGTHGADNQLATTPGMHSDPGEQNQSATNPSLSNDLGKQNQPATIPDLVCDTGAGSQPDTAYTGTSGNVPGLPTSDGINHDIKDGLSDSKSSRDSIISAIASKIASMMGTAKDPPESTGSPTIVPVDESDATATAVASPTATSSSSDAALSTQKNEGPVQAKEAPGTDYTHSALVPDMPQSTAPTEPSPQLPMVTQIISASRDKTFCVWDVSSVTTPRESRPDAELDRVLPSFQSSQHLDEIRSVAFSNDGLKAFVGIRDGSVAMWDSSSNDGPSGGPSCYSWLASANKRASFMWPGGERVAVNSLAVAPPPPPPSEPTSLSSPPVTEVKLACGLDDGRITIWDLSSGNAQFEGELQHSSSVVSVGYSPDGKRIAACTKEGIIAVWDANGPSGECILEQLTRNDRWFP